MQASLTEEPDMRGQDGQEPVQQAESADALSRLLHFMQKKEEGV